MTDEPVDATPDERRNYRDTLRRVMDDPRWQSAQDVKWWRANMLQLLTDLDVLEAAFTVGRLAKAIHQVDDRYCVHEGPQSECEVRARDILAALAPDAPVEGT